MFKRIGTLFLNLQRNRQFSSGPVALKSKLNAGQASFAKRLEIHDFPASKLVLTTNDKTEDFPKLVQIGHESFIFFTREYLKTRFPALSEKYLEIAMKMFLDEKNVLSFARFLGIEAFLENDSIATGDVQLDCFKAILGLMASEGSPLKLRNFLDSRYFNNSVFDAKDLVRPLYPIPELTELHPNLVFRLHQESGRLSSQSMFIVGVYSDKSSKTCLAEGHGASQALAQHRAATEALRKLYLVEKMVSNRPSDDMKSISEIVLNK